MIDVATSGQRQSITATTLVLTHNWVGRTYLTIISRFTGWWSAPCYGRSPPKRRVPYMTLSVDLFYSYRSPYSYLALPRTLQLVADYDLTVNLRPVYPLAVREPGFFKKTNPKFSRYVALDAIRVAEHENIPFRFPRPDPIVQDRARSKSLPSSPISIA